MCWCAGSAARSVRRLEMPSAHLLQNRDGQEGRQRVQASDEDEDGGPASGRLLEECRRWPAEDRTHALRDIEEAVVGGGIFRPEGVGKGGREERENLAPAEKHQSGEHDKHR